MLEIRSNTSAADRARAAIQNGINNFGDPISVTEETTTTRISSRIERVSSLSESLKTMLESAMTTDVTHIQSLSNSFVTQDNKLAKENERSFGGRSGVF